MSVARDILVSYRAPARQMRRMLADGPREERALAMLMGALAMFFLAKWPELLRASRLDPRVPFDARMGGALMGLIFLMPLVAYAVAALSYLLLRPAGWRGSWYAARLALFWSLLAISPLVLAEGLVLGLAGPGRWVAPVGYAVLAAFLWLWAGALWGARDTARRAVRPADAGTGRAEDDRAAGAVGDALRPSETATGTGRNG